MVKTSNITFAEFNANRRYQEFSPFALDSTYQRSARTTNTSSADWSQNFPAPFHSGNLRGQYSLVGKGKQCGETNKKTKCFSCGIIRFKGVKSKCKILISSWWRLAKNFEISLSFYLIVIPIAHCNKIVALCTTCRTLW